MLEEDLEGVRAAQKKIFIKMLGLLALAVMTGILLNVILGLLALTVERWRRIRRAGASGTGRMPKEGAMKPRAADGK